MKGPITKVNSATLFNSTFHAPVVSEQRQAGSVGFNAVLCPLGMLDRSRLNKAV